tara:strand:+ start:2765 stop:2902 length:138 start_codon:yes stop_codon:yes gene_type:complete
MNGTLFVQHVFIMARPQCEWRSAEGISVGVLSKLRRFLAVDALQH